MDVGVGIVGYGLMAKAHTFGYRNASAFGSLAAKPKVVAMSGRNPVALAAAAALYGVPDTTSDWRTLLDRDDVDVIDICTPPGTHAEIAIAAAAAGKAVICEKPLAASFADALAATRAVEDSGVANAVGFNYRRLPALALLQRLISDGRIGRVLTWHATWFTDEFADPEIPFDWRFDLAMGASTFADLGSHLIDLALTQVGPVDAVSAQTQTTIAERSGQAVTVPESCSALLRFASGASGVIDLARNAVGRPCDFVVDVSGTEGSLRFDYARLNELWFSHIDDDPELYGPRRIRAEHTTHPYSANWWPIGQGVGYGSSFVNQVVAWFAEWPPKTWDPDFAQGTRVQAICDAMERSSLSDHWEQVPTFDLNPANKL